MGKVSFSSAARPMSGIAVVVEIAEIHAHPGNQVAVFRQRHIGLERNLLELLLPLL